MITSLGVNFIELWLLLTHLMLHMITAELILYRIYECAGVFPSNFMLEWETLELSSQLPLVCKSSVLNFSYKYDIGKRIFWQQYSEMSLHLILFHFDGWFSMYVSEPHSHKVKSTSSVIGRSLQLNQVSRNTSTSFCSSRKLVLTTHRPHWVYKKKLLFLQTNLYSDWKKS